MRTLFFLRFRLDPTARRWNVIAFAMFGVEFAMLLGSMLVNSVLPFLAYFLAIVIGSVAMYQGNRCIRTTLRAQRGEVCFGCGYDLRGLQVGGNCPECGKLIDAEERRSILAAWNVAE